MELPSHPAHGAVVRALSSIEGAENLDLAAAAFLAQLQVDGYNVTTPPEPGWELTKALAHAERYLHPQAPHVAAQLEGLHRSIREDLASKGFDPGDPTVLVALLHGAVTASVISGLLQEPEIGPNAIKSFVMARVADQWL